MRYYTLKKQYALRGWSDLKYAILDLECMTEKGKYLKLTKYQFEALELITAGGISIDEKLLPDGIEKLAQWAFDKGILEECGRDHCLEDYQRYRCSKARFTYALLWSITGKCNLRCRHCYVSSGGDGCAEISMEQCDEVIRQCREANIDTVALTGGEPLVRKDFWQLVDRLLENHIKILQVFTNGMLVNEKFLDEFAGRNINPNYFMLSFDGVNCHDWLRGVRGAEKGAIRAIRLLRSRGYQVVASMAIHMGNVDSLMETYELMKELGVAKWKAVPIVDAGNWKKQANREISIDRVYQKYLQLIEKYKADGMPLILGLGGFFQGRRENGGYSIPFVSGCGSCERCSETLCEATRYFPYLLPDGRVLPCIAMSGSEMEDIAPNIFDRDQSLETALSNSAVDTYTGYTYADLFAHNPECAACEHRLVCGGCRANALACGGFFEKDPLACHFIKGGYEQKIRKIMSGDRGTEICLSD